MSNNIEQYLTIFFHSKQYLIISGNIYQYLTISNNIEQDSKLFCTPYDIIQFWNFFISFFFTLVIPRGAFAPKKKNWYQTLLSVIPSRGRNSPLPHPQCPVGNRVILVYTWEFSVSWCLFLLFQKFLHLLLCAVIRSCLTLPDI